MSGSNERRVSGTIDIDAFYGATVAAGGGYVFLGATAIDDSGGLQASAQPPEPYQTSPAAQAQAQGRYVFERLDEQLPNVGSSVGDIVQVEQYVLRKVHSDGYFKVATAKNYLGKALPVAATAQVGTYVPADAAVVVTGMAIVPDEAGGLTKGYPDDGGTPAPNRKFSELVTAGPYAFTTIFATDRKTGIPESARAPEWIWSGSEIGLETKWCLTELATRLESVGATPADIVDYTLFLTDASDLFEWDEALRAVAGDPAPSRTVIPSNGYALPRREGAFGHAAGAPRLEAQFRIRLPSSGQEKRAIEGPAGGIGYQSAGVQLGPVAWLSSAVAAAEARGQGTEREIDDILAQLAATCANAGTSLGNALRVRALLTRAEDAPLLAAALRRAIPNDPPVCVVAVIPSPLPIADASVAIDAVVWVP